MIKIMSEIYGKEILEKAKKELTASGENGATELTNPYEALRIMSKLQVGR